MLGLGFWVKGYELIVMGSDAEIFSMINNFQLIFISVFHFLSKISFEKKHKNCDNNKEKK